MCVCVYLRFCICTSNSTRFDDRVHYQGPSCMLLYSSINRWLYDVAGTSHSYVVYSTYTSVGVLLRGTAMTCVIYVPQTAYTSECVFVCVCAARLSMPGLSAEAHYQDAVVSQ